MLAIDMNAIAIPENRIRSTNPRHPLLFQRNTLRDAGEEECGDIDL